MQRELTTRSRRQIGLLVLKQEDSRWSSVPIPKKINLVDTSTKLIRLSFDATRRPRISVTIVPRVCHNLKRYPRQA